MNNKDSIRQLGNHTWVLEGPTNVGFIENNTDVYLIDSGNDKEAGRRISKVVQEQNWNLKAIINTHSNADHIGGNDYLQRKYSCDVYAPGIENVFIEHPELEAAFLWGGMEVKDIRNKFFRAKPSKVTGTVHEESEISSLFRVHRLPGHYFNMVGIETKDNVLFIADSLFGKPILEKYGIPFIYDVRGYIRTIESIMSRKMNYYVPSHADITTDIREIAQLNMDAVKRIEDFIVSILQEAKNYDVILKTVCDEYDLQLDYAQYALVGSTIRSFLSCLYNEGRIQSEFVDNILYWKS